MHSKPSNMDEAAAKAILKNIAIFGQFLGALYNMYYDLPVVGYQDDVEEGVQNVA